MIAPPDNTQPLQNDYCRNWNRYVEVAFTKTVDCFFPKINLFSLNRTPSVGRFKFPRTDAIIDSKRIPYLNRGITIPPQRFVVE